MSILEQINNTKTEEKLAQEGDTDKAELLKAAEKRWHNLEKL